MMARLALCVMALLLFFSCSSDESGSTPNPSQQFDRGELLEGIADNYLKPAISTYKTNAESLELLIDEFTSNPSEGKLNEVREQFKLTYLAFQPLEVLMIGEAESNDFVGFTNTYPTNPAKIENQISSGNVNLSLPSNRDATGLPALDYLLYGKSNLLTEIQTNTHLNEYLTAIAAQLTELATLIYQDWNGSFRNDFISNNGSNANASVDLFVNDMINYYERRLRAGKIGIPAGVFSNSARPQDAEAIYNGALSKQLLLTATDSFYSLFNGNYKGNQFKSFKHYLEAIDAKKDGQPLSSLINSQLTEAKEEAQQLNDDIATHVENNNSEVLSVYDEYQRVVVLLKVDMTQALNISIDYVDTDGD